MWMRFQYLWGLDLRTPGSGDAGSPVVEEKKANAFRLSWFGGAVRGWDRLRME
jgi:hypothetical protein